MKFGKLIVFYGENYIIIDGNISITFTYDIEAGLESYGWQVLCSSMYDSDEIHKLAKEKKSDAEHPTLLMLKSIIVKSALK